MSDENSMNGNERAPGPATPSILGASTRQDEFQPQPGPGPRLSRSNLFVAGLSKSLTSADLKTLFSPYGEVVSAKVMVDLETGRSRQFGFVLFKVPEDAARALTSMNNTSVEGMEPIHVAFARYTDTDREEVSEKLYVRNVPHHVSQRQLLALFSQYGTVKEAAFLPGSSQTSQVGFVRFESVEDAKRAKDAVANTKPFDEENAILVRFMENSDMRQNRQQQHHHQHYVQQARRASAVPLQAAPAPPPMFMPPPHSPAIHSYQQLPLPQAVHDPYRMQSMTILPQPPPMMLTQMPVQQMYVQNTMPQPMPMRPNQVLFSPTSPYAPPPYPPAPAPYYPPSQPPQSLAILQSQTYQQTFQPVPSPFPPGGQPQLAGFQAGDILVRKELDVRMVEYVLSRMVSQVRLTSSRSTVIRLHDPKFAAIALEKLRNANLGPLDVEIL